MEVNRKSRLELRVQNWIFLLLFLTAVGLLAWLSQRYSVEADWTASGRNTLAEATVRLLERIEGPVKITAFATESELTSPRKRIRDLIERYQRHKSDIALEFVNPETDPQRTRELDIKVDGELVLEYRGRTEHVQRVTEENLTNALQRLLRRGERKLVFVTGHGERDPHGRANFDLGEFVRRLEDKGLKAETVNLAEAKAIPEDTAVLIIAGPRVAWLEGEVKLVLDYLDRGGRLLWLHDPGPLHGLEPLAEKLGITFVPGVVVDPTTQLLGIRDPAIALVVAYPPHPVTSDFHFMTLYPQAAGIRATGARAAGWTARAFLQSSPGSWAETGPLRGVIKADGKDTPGPLDLGLALTRTPAGEKGDNDKGQDNPGPDQPAVKKKAEQRVVVIGDGDFLSNTFLGNQGNQDLGFNVINWLSHDDTFINIPAKVAPDTRLNLSRTAWAVIALFFLIGLPVILLGSGIWIWHRRRRR